jgi:endonuclease/exonuclease/phosphatase family metal-dependent hydrolase
MRINIGTYNICHGEGLDGKIDMKRQGEFIKDNNLDIVLLQEVDSHTDRAQYNEAEEISKYANLKHFYFGKVRNFLNGSYGNGIVSIYEMVDTNTFMTEVGKDHEERGIIHSKIKIEDKYINLFSVHFPVYEDERIKYVEKLYELINPIKDELIVIGGDFNNGIVKIGDHKYIYEDKKEYFEYKELENILIKLNNKDITWRSATGSACIDTFFYSKDFKLIDFATIDNDCSDHSMVRISLEI